jgi:hypothetical protein
MATEMDPHSANDCLDYEPNHSKAGTNHKTSKLNTCHHGQRNQRLWIHAIEKMHTLPFD